MMAEGAEPLHSDGPLSDEEIRRRMMADAEVQASIEKALARRRGIGPENSLTAEELPDFLREHG
jgi:hypothetical protein